MNVLVFIPARGGSKGIKRKNLSKIGNKKLIDYSLDIASKLPKNFRTLVSSDNLETLNYCKKKGISSNYTRPISLSTDKSKIVDAVLHALNWLNKIENYCPDAVLLLQPTSPFRNLKEIKSAIKKFKSKKVESMFGVVKMKEHPRECINANKSSWSYLKKNTKKINGRQDYESDYYFIDGSFYLSSTTFIKKYKSFVVENKSIVYKFNSDYSIDIDDMSDLRLARIISQLY